MQDALLRLSAWQTPILCSGLLAPTNVFCLLSGEGQPLLQRVDKGRHHFFPYFWTRVQQVGTEQQSGVGVCY